jgi:hypothetical protein
MRAEINEDLAGYRALDRESLPIQGHGARLETFRVPGGDLVAIPVEMLQRR